MSNRRRPDGTYYPVYDRNSHKYPERVFLSGQWHTQERAECLRQLDFKRRPRKNSGLREKYAIDPMTRLRKAQYGTLRQARKSLERSIRNADLQY